MQNLAKRPGASTAICTSLGAIFVSLELSRSTWLVTSLSPGGGERMSRHSVTGGDVTVLLARLADLQEKAQVLTGRCFPVIVIQEAGLDGFWIHRALRKEGVESHVVDLASIAVQRRRRRAKTDQIDGEALVRALLAYKRGEPRVCAMVRVPTGGGRSAPALSGAQVPDRRAHPACKPSQGTVLRARNHWLRAAPPRQARAAGGVVYR